MSALSERKIQIPKFVQHHALLNAVGVTFHSIIFPLIDITVNFKQKTPCFGPCNLNKKSHLNIFTSGCQDTCEF